LNASPSDVTPVQSTKFYKRPLVPALFAYCAGAYLGRDALPLWPSLFVAAYAILIVVAICYSIRARNFTTVFLLGFAAVGAWRISGFVADRDSATELSQKLDDTALPEFTGTVASQDEETNSGRHKILLQNIRVMLNKQQVEIPGRVQALLPSDVSDLSSFTPGNLVHGAGYLSVPLSVSNFNIYNYRESLAVSEIYTTARIPNSRFIKIERRTTFAARLQAALAGFRRFCESSIYSSIPKQQADQCAAMLFNDLGKLSDTDKQAYRDSGTMHLFSVSGLHIAVFAMVLSLLFRAMRFSHRWAWTASCIVLLCYVLLLDFVAPALRSLIMFSSYTAGRWMKREVDNISSMVLGAAIILVLHPLDLWQASFWLSFMGVAGIITFLPLFLEWTSSPHRRAVTKWLIESLAVTLAVSVMIFPLQLWYFQQFNCLSPITNLFAALLSFPILAGTILTICVSPISAALAQLSGAATAICMQMMTGAAHIAANQNWALLLTAKPAACMVALYYVLLFAGHYLVHRQSPEFLFKSRARFAIHLPLAILLLLGSTAFAAQPGKLRLWFLDVGQGDSTLVQFPTGESLLLDAGNIQPDYGKLVVVPELKALGITRLGTIVATHDDADHIGGIPYVSNHWRVESLVEGTSSTQKSELSAMIQQSAELHHLNILLVHAGQVFRCGKAEVEVLNPQSAANTAAESDNSRSVVLKITYGKFSVLLMGDADISVEKRLLTSKKLECDLLKVGHHGSRTSSCPEFIATVQPKVSVISCGWRNRYGHPSPEVIHRLGSTQTRVYRTDLQGAVLVETDGNTFTVQSAQ
jgi:competence protein ComEC